MVKTYKLNRVNDDNFKVFITPMTFNEFTGSNLNSRIPIIMVDMILVLGQSDAHVEMICSKIEARGKKALALDTRYFPERLQIAYNTDAIVEGTLKIVDGDNVTEIIELSDITAVYWECYAGVYPDAQYFGKEYQFAYQECETAIKSLFEMMNHCLWVNPPSNVLRHQLKPYQSQMAKELGVVMPDTLITNDPDALKTFFEKHDKQIISKPISGMGILNKIEEKDLVSDTLKRLCKMPIQFQEYVSGIDYRVHIVGDEVFVAEIVSETLNYKTDKGFFLQASSVPEEIIETSKKIAEKMGYVLTGIDWRKRPDGEFVFIEVNPSPKFMLFEEQCGQPIGDALAELLVSIE